MKDVDAQHDLRLHVKSFVQTLQEAAVGRATEVAVSKAKERVNDGVRELHRCCAVSSTQRQPAAPRVGSDDAVQRAVVAAPLPPIVTRVADGSARRAAGQKSASVDAVAPARGNTLPTRMKSASVAHEAKAAVGLSVSLPVIGRGRAAKSTPVRKAAAQPPALARTGVAAASTPAQQCDTMGQPLSGIDVFLRECLDHASGLMAEAYYTEALELFLVPLCAAFPVPVCGNRADQWRSAAAPGARDRAERGTGWSHQQTLSHTASADTMGWGRHRELLLFECALQTSVCQFADAMDHDPFLEARNALPRLRAYLSTITTNMYDMACADADGFSHLLFNSSVHVYQMCQRLLRHAPSSASVVCLCWHDAERTATVGDGDASTGQPGPATRVAESFSAGSILLRVCPSIPDMLLSVGHVQSDPTVAAPTTGTQVGDELSRLRQLQQRRRLRVCFCCEAVCTEALAFCVEMMETVLRFATVRYLPWRTQLYALICRCYESMGDYATALTVSRRAEWRLLDLMSLEYLDTVPPPMQARYAMESGLHATRLQSLRLKWMRAATTPTATASSSSRYAPLQRMPQGGGSGADEPVSAALLRGGPSSAAASLLRSRSQQQSPSSPRLRPAVSTTRPVANSVSNDTQKKRRGLQSAMETSEDLKTVINEDDDACNGGRTTAAAAPPSASDEQFARWLQAVQSADAAPVTLPTCGKSLLQQAKRLLAPEEAPRPAFSPLQVTRELLEFLIALEASLAEALGRVEQEVGDAGDGAAGGSEVGGGLTVPQPAALSADDVARTALPQSSKRPGTNNGRGGAGAGAVTGGAGVDSAGTNLASSASDGGVGTIRALHLHVVSALEVLLTPALHADVLVLLQRRRHQQQQRRRDRECKAATSKDIGFVGDTATGNGRGAAASPSLGELDVSVRPSAEEPWDRIASTEQPGGSRLVTSLLLGREVVSGLRPTSAGQTAFSSLYPEISAGSPLDGLVFSMLRVLCAASRNPADHPGEHRVSVATVDPEEAALLSGTAFAKLLFCARQGLLAARSNGKARQILRAELDLLERLRRVYECSPKFNKKLGDGSPGVYPSGAAKRSQSLSQRPPDEERRAALRHLAVALAAVVAAHRHVERRDLHGYTTRPAAPDGGVSARDGAAELLLSDRDEPEGSLAHHRHRHHRRQHRERAMACSVSTELVNQAAQLMVAEWNDVSLGMCRGSSGTTNSGDSFITDSPEAAIVYYTALHALLWTHSAAGDALDDAHDGDPDGDGTGSSAPERSCRATGTTTQTLSAPRHPVVDPFGGAARRPVRSHHVSLAKINSDETRQLGALALLTIRALQTPPPSLGEKPLESAPSAAPDAATRLQQEEEEVVEVWSALRHVISALCPSKHHAARAGELDATAHGSSAWRREGVPLAALGVAELTFYHLTWRQRMYVQHRAEAGGDAPLALMRVAKALEADLEHSSGTSSSVFCGAYHPLAHSGGRGGGAPQHGRGPAQTTRMRAWAAVFERRAGRQADAAQPSGAGAEHHDAGKPPSERLTFIQNPDERLRELTDLRTLLWRRYVELRYNVAVDHAIDAAGRRKRKEMNVLLDRQQQSHIFGAIKTKEKRRLKELQASTSGLAGDAARESSPLRSRGDGTVQEPTQVLSSVAAAVERQILEWVRGNALLEAVTYFTLASCQREPARKAEAAAKGLAILHHLTATIREAAPPASDGDAEEGVPPMALIHGTTAQSLSLPFTWALAAQTCGPLDNAAWIRDCERVLLGYIASNLDESSVCRDADVSRPFRLRDAVAAEASPVLTVAIAQALLATTEAQMRLTPFVPPHRFVDDPEKGPDHRRFKTVAMQRVHIHCSHVLLLVVDLLLQRGDDRGGDVESDGASALNGSTGGVSPRLLSYAATVPEAEIKAGEFLLPRLALQLYDAVLPLVSGGCCVTQAARPLFCVCAILLRLRGKSYWAAPAVQLLAVRAVSSVASCATAAPTALKSSIRRMAADLFVHAWSQVAQFPSERQRQHMLRAFQRATAAEAVVHSEMVQPPAASEFHETATVESGSHKHGVSISRVKTVTITTFTEPPRPNTNVESVGAGGERRKQMVSTVEEDAELAALPCPYLTNTITLGDRVPAEYLETLFTVLFHLPGGVAACLAADKQYSAARQALTSSSGMADLAARQVVDGGGGGGADGYDVAVAPPPSGGVDVGRKAAVAKGGATDVGKGKSRGNATGGNPAVGPVAALMPRPKTGVRASGALGLKEPEWDLPYLFPPLAMQVAVLAAGGDYGGAAMRLHADAVVDPLYAKTAVSLAEVVLRARQLKRLKELGEAALGHIWRGHRQVQLMQEKCFREHQEWLFREKYMLEAIAPTTTTSAPVEKRAGTVTPGAVDARGGSRSNGKKSLASAGVGLGSTPSSSHQTRSSSLSSEISTGGTWLDAFPMVPRVMAQQAIRQLTHRVSWLLRRHAFHHIRGLYIQYNVVFQARLNELLARERAWELDQQRTSLAVLRNLTQGVAAMAACEDAAEGTSTATQAPVPRATQEVLGSAPSLSRLPRSSTVSLGGSHQRSREANPSAEAQGSVPQGPFAALVKSTGGAAIAALRGTLEEECVGLLRKVLDRSACAAVLFTRCYFVQHSYRVISFARDTMCATIATAPALGARVAVSEAVQAMLSEPPRAGRDAGGGAGTTPHPTDSSRLFGSDTDAPSTRDDRDEAFPCAFDSQSGGLEPLHHADDWDGRGASVLAVLPSAGTVRRIGQSIQRIAQQLCELAETVAAGGVDAAIELELLVPTVVKVGASVTPTEAVQWEVKATIPSLFIALSPAGEFAERQRRRRPAGGAGLSSSPLAVTTTTTAAAGGTATCTWRSRSLCARLGTEVGEEELVHTWVYFAALLAPHPAYRCRVRDALLYLRGVVDPRYAAVVLPLVLDIQTALAGSCDTTTLREYEESIREKPLSLQLLHAVQVGRQRCREGPQHPDASLEPPVEVLAALPRDAPGTTRGRGAVLDSTRPADGSTVALRQLLRRYTVTIRYLRSINSLQWLGQCLYEQGHLYLAHNKLSGARRCWNDAIDAALRQPQATENWREFLATIRSGADMQAIGPQRVVYAFASLTSLAMFANGGEVGQAVNHCLMASELIHLLTRHASLAAPQELWQFGLRGMADVPQWVRPDGESARELVAHLVPLALYGARLLLDAGYAARAGILASFAEHIAVHGLGDLQLTILARVLRARTAAAQGNYQAAFLVLAEVCQGVDIPTRGILCVSTALAPWLGPLSLVETCIGVGAAGGADGPSAVGLSGGGTGAESIGAGTASGAVGSKRPARGDGGGEASSSSPGGFTTAGAAGSRGGALVMSPEYDNQLPPSHPTNIKAVESFVGACAANQVVSSASEPLVSVTAAARAKSPHHSSIPVQSSPSAPAFQLRDPVLRMYGEALSFHVLHAIADVLVSLGSREGLCGSAIATVAAPTVAAYVLRAPSPMSRAVAEGEGPSTGSRGSMPSPNSGSVAVGQRAANSKSGRGRALGAGRSESITLQSLAGVVETLQPPPVIPSPMDGPLLHNACSAALSFADAVLSSMLCEKPAANLAVSVMASSELGRLAVGGATAMPSWGDEPVKRLGVALLPTATKTRMAGVGVGVGVGSGCGGGAAHPGGGAAKAGAPSQTSATPGAAGKRKTSAVALGLEKVVGSRTGTQEWADRVGALPTAHIPPAPEELLGLEVSARLLEARVAIGSGRLVESNRLLLQLLAFVRVFVVDATRRQRGLGTAWPSSGPGESWDRDKPSIVSNAEGGGPLEVAYRGRASGASTVAVRSPLAVPPFISAVTSLELCQVYELLALNSLRLDDGEGAMAAVRCGLGLAQDYRDEAMSCRFHVLWQRTAARLGMGTRALRVLEQTLSTIRRPTVFFAVASHLHVRLRHEMVELSSTGSPQALHHALFDPPAIAEGIAAMTVAVRELWESSHRTGLPRSPPESVGGGAAHDARPQRGTGGGNVVALLNPYAYALHVGMNELALLQMRGARFQDAQTTLERAIRNVAVYYDTSAHPTPLSESQLLLAQLLRLRHAVPCPLCRKVMRRGAPRRHGTHRHGPSPDAHVVAPPPRPSLSAQETPMAPDSLAGLLFTSWPLLLVSVASTDMGASTTTAPRTTGGGGKTLTGNVGALPTAMTLQGSELEWLTRMQEVLQLLGQQSARSEASGTAASVLLAASALTGDPSLHARGTLLVEAVASMAAGGIHSYAAIRLALAELSALCCSAAGRVAALEGGADVASAASAPLLAVLCPPRVAGHSRASLTSGTCPAVKDGRDADAMADRFYASVVALLVVRLQRAAVAAMVVSKIVENMERVVLGGGAAVERVCSPAMPAVVSLVPVTGLDAGASPAPKESPPGYVLHGSLPEPVANFVRDLADVAAMKQFQLMTTWKTAEQDKAAFLAAGAQGGPDLDSAPVPVPTTTSSRLRASSPAPAGFANSGNSGGGSSAGGGGGANPQYHPTGLGGAPPMAARQLAAFPFHTPGVATAVPLSDVLRAFAHLHRRYATASLWERMENETILIHLRNSLRARSGPLSMRSLFPPTSMSPPPLTTPPPSQSSSRAQQAVGAVPSTTSLSLGTYSGLSAGMSSSSGGGGGGGAAGAALGMPGVAGGGLGASRRAVENEVHLEDAVAQLLPLVVNALPDLFAPQVLQQQLLVPLSNVVVTQSFVPHFTAPPMLWKDGAWIPCLPFTTLLMAVSPVNDVNAVTPSAQLLGGPADGRDDAGGKHAKKAGAAASQPPPHSQRHGDGGGDALQRGRVLVPVESGARATGGRGRSTSGAKADPRGAEERDALSDDGTWANLNGLHTAIAAAERETFSVVAITVPQDTLRELGQLARRILLSYAKAEEEKEAAATSLSDLLADATALALASGSTTQREGGPRHTRGMQSPSALPLSLPVVLGTPTAVTGPATTSTATSSTVAAAATSSTGGAALAASHGGGEGSTWHAKGGVLPSNRRGGDTVAGSREKVLEEDKQRLLYGFVSAVVEATLTPPPDPYACVVGTTGDEAPGANAAARPTRTTNPGSRPGQRVRHQDVCVLSDERRNLEVRHLLERAPAVVDVDVVGFLAEVVEGRGGAVSLFRPQLHEWFTAVVRWVERVQREMEAVDVV